MAVATIAALPLPCMSGLGGDSGAARVGGERSSGEELEDAESNLSGTSERR